jgi:hypothetical protein
MTDATTARRSHAHGHAPGHAHDHAGGAARAHAVVSGAAQVRPQRRTSLLDSSAGARLSGIFPIVALLWAGVYWALH